MGNNIAAASLERSLAEELRELRKLAMDRRAVSLALFRNSSKHPTIAHTDAPTHEGKRGAA